MLIEVPLSLAEVQAEKKYLLDDVMLALAEVLIAEVLLAGLMLLLAL